LNSADARAAQAMADVATISVLQQRSLNKANSGRGQLQRALSSRIVVEQAKGYMAHANQMDVDDAFQIIRTYARSHALKLTDVARSIVNHELTLDSPEDSTSTNR
jgi:AmiR/NasT family two-component response regulator